MGLATQWSEGVLHAADIVAHVGMLADDPEHRRDLYTGVRACERAVAGVRAEHAREQRRRDAASRPR